MKSTAGALSIDFPATTDSGSLTQVAGQQTAAATKNGDVPIVVMESGDLKVAMRA